jgi:oxygen-independent coproporphyrinogen III oxidase
MAGIYIHIPFCKQKCSYCDFHFSTSFSSYRDRMIDALCEEIIIRKDYLSGTNLQSVYFGGGTPSLLTKEELQKIFATIHVHFNLAPDAEVTLEANPDDITENILLAWKEVGINRLSIGVQSFKQEDLDWMNRAHNVNEALNAVDLAKHAGITNITIDLIYGLPNLSNEEWLHHLEKALSMDIDHISAYCLTVEDRTALHTMVKKGQIKPAGEDQQSEQFKLLVDTLTSNGYEQYEISNFAKEKRYAVHNTSYWLGKKYLGIGPSAHSYNGIERRWNVSNNTVYLKSLGENENWYEMEILSAKDRWNELILTGLRTKFGVDLNVLKKIATPSIDFYAKIEDFQANGLMSNQEERLVLTLNGRLQADYISSELFL